MKLFKEFLSKNEAPQYEWCTIEADDEVIHILFKNSKTSALYEAKNRGVPVGGAYALQFHKKHSPVGKDHIHGYERNNQLFVLNVGGTAHDQSHGVRIPNKLAKAIKHHFPGIVLPPDNIIEWAPQAVQIIAQQCLLLE